jgi:hypothetical protein
MNPSEANVEATQLETLATLRAVVGFLGEKDQYGWWQSAFFSPASKAFLAPVFARTQVLAQCSGVSQAAALIHDERIGVGHVYHLFRLPEDLEQSIHQAIHEPELCVRLLSLVATRDGASDYLRQLAGTSTAYGIGPVRVGNATDLRQPEPLRLLAAQYLQGFQAGAQVYPFFSGGTA